jgi:hypothetical protein
MARPTLLFEQRANFGRERDGVGALGGRRGKEEEGRVKAVHFELLGYVQV